MSKEFSCNEITPLELFNEVTDMLFITVNKFSLFPHRNRKTETSKQWFNRLIEHAKSQIIRLSKMYPDYFEEEFKSLEMIVSSVEDIPLLLADELETTLNKLINYHLTISLIQPSIFN